MKLETILEIVDDIECETGGRPASVYCSLTLYDKFFKDVAALLGRFWWNPGYQYDFFEYSGIQFIRDNSVLLEFSYDKKDYDCEGNIFIDEVPHYGFTINSDGNVEKRSESNKKVPLYYDSTRKKGVYSDKIGDTFSYLYDPKRLYKYNKQYSKCSNSLDDLAKEIERLVDDSNRKKPDNLKLIDKNKKCECGLAAIGDGLPSSRHMEKCPAYIEE